MEISAINELGREAFVALLGGIYEHSSWVAEQAFVSRPFGSIAELADRMEQIVGGAGEEAQLALLRAHPDLGTRARVTQSSAQEQAGAGLTALTQGEYDELLRLNGEYRVRFGFPFIVAVRSLGTGSSVKAAIMEALRQRGASSPQEEFKEALRQVFRIARFRLEDL